MKIHWKLCIFLAVLSIFRFVYAGLTNLTPDEAYYWEWSRHLQLSYYDHPPMVAYFIRLATWLGQSNSEIWVRFPGMLVGIGVSLAAYFMGRDMFQSEVTGFYAALFLNLVLMISLGCFIITPDTPQGLFAVFTLYFFYRGLEGGQGHWWIFSGVCLGLCMLSKYTGVLLIPGILLTLATSPTHRKWLFRKQLYGAAGVAALFTLPILIWNIRHHWISIAFQSRHGFWGLEVRPWSGFFDFIGTQFGLLTPVIFLGVLSAMIYCFHHRRDHLRYHFVFWNSAPMLLFFCLLSFRQKIEGNWASLSYFVPLVATVGIGMELEKNAIKGWRGKWVAFLKWGSVSSSLLILCFVYVHAVTPLVSLPKKLDVTRRLHGWDLLGEKVESALDMMKEQDSDPFVFGNRHQIISEVSFYLKEQPQIYKTGGGKRYSYIKNTHQLLGRDAVYVAEKARSQLKKIRKGFKRMDKPVILTIRRANRVIWEFVIVKCYDYQGGLINV